MPKRAYCGFELPYGEVPFCAGPVEWVTMHVARCPHCGAIWWWQPRHRVEKRWVCLDEGGWRALRAAGELIEEIGRLRETLFAAQQAAFTEGLRSMERPTATKGREKQ